MLVQPRQSLPVQEQGTSTPIPIQRPSRPEPRVDKTLYLPGKYEVTPDQTFSFSILIKEYKGRWIITDHDGKGVDTHTVTFRLWNYEEMIDLRRRATSFDPIKRSSVVDNDALNRFKIQRLLQSWTFDKDNPRFSLHRQNGVLTDESWKAFVKLSPNIAERIINEMNMVLDYGG